MAQRAAPLPTGLLARTLVLAPLALLLLLALAPGEANAHPRKNGPFGLGVILGEPTGLTGKYFFTDMIGLDFHIGIEGLDDHRHEDFGLYADLLFHFPVGEFSWATLPLYIGPGLALIFDDDHCFRTRFGRHCDRYHRFDDDGIDLHLAIRAPFGLAFWFSKFGGEAFVELTLQLFVLQHVDVDLDFATGFRYYF